MKRVPSTGTIPWLRRGSTYPSPPPSRGTGMSGRSLPRNQHMARVQAEPNRWSEFRGLAKTKGRTVAGYLGWLVEKELRRARRSEARRVARPMRALTEVDENWVPPWEV